MLEEMVIRYYSDSLFGISDEEDLLKEMECLSSETMKNNIDPLWLSVWRDL